MAEKIIVPSLGTTVKKAKVAKWLIKVGQTVRKGDIVCEIETEKVSFKVEAPASGVLANILVAAGSVAGVGQTIGLIEVEGEAIEDVPSLDATATSIPVSDRATSVGRKEANAPVERPQNGRIRISPVARNIAKEKGVDISLVTGSGPSGRILKADVLSYADSRLPEAAEDVATEINGVVFGAEIPLTNIRKIIGDRLTRSARDVPHVYFSCEVDCTEMIKFRSIFKDIVAKKSKGKLSYNDLIIKAVATTIEKYPLFNAVLEDETIKIGKSVDVGLAMALEEGLIVPVIRETHRKSLSHICLARQAVIQKAQDKKLTMDDLTGSTFTVSNLGQFNIDFFTSIINPPETAILSVARMKDRAVVVDGELAVRPIMKMGLSIDHRIVDGADGARFLEDLQTLLENPFEMCTI